MTQVQVCFKEEKMDLTTIFVLIVFVIAVFVFPSSVVNKIERTFFSRLKHPQNTSRVIDLEEIKKNLG